MVKVSVALIGAKGFGKSNFYKRGMLRVYKRASSFCIGDKQKMDDYNDDDIHPTSETDPLSRCVFSTGRKRIPCFEITFFDYAGEIAAREEPSGLKGVLLRSIYKCLFSWSWVPASLCPRWMSATSLADKIHGADAVMIMLPADLDKKDLPIDATKNNQPRYELHSFEKNVEEWASHNDSRPVYVVVNKCDLLERSEVGNVDLVLKKPVIDHIFQSLCDCVGEERIKTAMVSIFPQKDDGGFITKKEELSQCTVDQLPYGIKDLIEAIVKNAEEARAKKLAAEWAVAGWWKKAFLMPFISLGVVRSGTENENLRQEILKIKVSAWSRLTFMIASIAIITFSLILGVCSLVELISENNFANTLASQRSDYSRLNPHDFQANSDFLEKQVWVRPLFFVGKIRTLREEENRVRSEFVGWLEEDLKAALSDVRVQKMDPWEVDPKVNDDRSKKRMELIRNHLKLLPNGSTSGVIAEAEREEKKYASDAVADSLFNRELFGLASVDRKRKVRAFVSVIDLFKDKAESRKSDYYKLAAAVTNLENELSVELKSELAEIDKRLSAQDWQGRVARLEAKNQLIKESLDWFALDGSQFMKWASEIKANETTIAHEKVYGPFDVAYKEIMATEGSGTLSTIEKFKKGYPLENYPERGEEYQALNEKERRQSEAIDDAVRHDVMKRADDDQQLMRTRIENAEARIRTYEGALKELNVNGAGAAELQAKIDGERKWIEDHRRYITFDDDVMAVEKLPSVSRVKPYIAFLSSHSYKDYPEYTNRIDNIENRWRVIETMILAKLKNELDEDRKKHKDGSWRFLVSIASNRIARVERDIPLVSDEGREKLEEETKTEMSRIRELTRNGMFDDALAKVKDAPQRCIIDEIMKFRNSFPAPDYLDRSADFLYLRSMETNIVSLVAVKFKADSDLPNPDSLEFEAWRIRSVKIRQAAEDALQYFPSNHYAALPYQERKVAASDDAKKYDTWNMLKEAASQIITSTNTPAKITLMNIGDFRRKYPRPSPMPKELASIYTGVDNIQRDAERSITQEIENDLAGSDVTSAATEKERQKAMGEKIQTLKTYLGYLVKNSAPWNNYSRMLEKLVADLSSEQRRTLYFDDLKKLMSSLQKTRGLASEKIRLIDEFLLTHSKDQYQGKEYEMEYKQLADRRLNLESESEWESFAVGIANLQRPKNEGANVRERLQEYRSQCEELREDMNIRFGKRQAFVSRVGKEQQKLDAEIAWVNNQIGDGSWLHVCELEERYKDDPSEDNIAAYRKELEEFDITRKGNVNYKMEREKSLKVFNEDLELKKSFIAARKRFKGSPNAGTFGRLKDATRKFCSHRARNKINVREVEDMQSWVTDVESGHVTVGDVIKWIAFDLEGTGLATWVGDNELKMHVGDAEQEVAGLCKVRSNRWKITDNNHRNWGHPVESGFQFKLDGCGSSMVPEVMKVKVVNHGCVTDRSGEGTVSFWKLVSKDTPDFDFDVRLSCSEVSGKRDAVVTLHFSGVRICPVARRQDEF